MTEAPLSREASARALEPTGLAAALRDAIAGREAIGHAYETAAARVSDPETATLLRRYAAEDASAAERWRARASRLGVDATGPRGLRDEVTAFIARTSLPTLRGTYADARMLVLLVGLESAALAGSDFLVRVLARVGDAEWRAESRDAITRSDARLDHLRGVLAEMGRVALGPDEPRPRLESVPED